MIFAVSGISVRLLALGYNPSFDEIMGAAKGGREMEPRAVERFTDAMAGEVEEQAQTRSPSAVDRTTGF
jgi:hypothetical protein